MSTFNKQINQSTRVMADFQTLKELPAALIEFHKTLPAIEEKTSGVHQSKYAPLSYIQGITVPLLGKQGLVCIQTFDIKVVSQFLAKPNSLKVR